MKKTLLVTAVAACAAFSTGAEAFNCSSVTGKLDCSKDYGPMYKPMYWQCLLFKGTIGGICQVVKLQVSQSDAETLTAACSSTDEKACESAIDTALNSIDTKINTAETGWQKEVLADVKSCLDDKKNCSPKTP